MRYVMRDVITLTGCDLKGHRKITILHWRRSRLALSNCCGPVSTWQVPTVSGRSHHLADPAGAFQSPAESLMNSLPATNVPTAHAQ